jgi:hypothetical protein
MNDFSDDGKQKHRCSVMMIYDLSITNSNRWNAAESATPDNREQLCKISLTTYLIRKPMHRLVCCAL